MKRQGNQGGSSNDGQTPANETIKMSIKRCRDLATSDIPDINMIRNANGDIVNIVSTFPRCPRTRNEARRGPFRNFPEATADCTRSTKTFKPDGGSNPLLEQT